jgi:hypothetical protein
MAADAKAVGYLELNITQFDQAIATAKKALVALTAAFTAFKTSEFFKEGIKDAISFSNELYHASQRLHGFDPEALFLVQKALEDAGVEAGEARAKIGEFLDDNRDLSQLFGGTEEYAAALRDASESYGSQAKLLGDNAEKFSKVFQIISSIGEKLRTFFIAMTSQFLKPLQALLEYINEIDLSGIGEQFGKYIADASYTLLGLFKNGNMLETFQLSLSIAAKTFVNHLTGGIEFAIDMLIAGITGIPWLEVVKLAMSAFAKLGVMLIEMFLKVGAYLAAIISTAMGKIVEALPAPVKKLIGFSGDFKAPSIQEGFEENKNLFKPSIDGLMDDISKFQGDSAKSVGESVKSALGSVNYKPSNLFDDLEGQTKKLKDNLSQALQTGKDSLAGTDQTKNKISPEAFKALEPQKVIADSLSRVGGGGGFLKVGQNLLEREAVKQTRAAEAGVKIMQNVDKNIQSIANKSNSGVASE